MSEINATKVEFKLELADAGLNVLDMKEAEHRVNICFIDFNGFSEGFFGLGA